nr:ABC transporter substrate-binding protein [Hydrococcus rivularis]
MIKRRRLINHLAIAAASSATLAACRRNQQLLVNTEIGQAEQTQIEWRMATSWSDKVETYYQAATRICDRVERLTNGNFKITPFPAGGIAPAQQILDAVGEGKVECGHTEGIYYVAKSPALSFATSIPFGFNPSQLMAWIYGGGALELLRKAYADFNVMYFPAGTTGPQMGGWFQQKIGSLADLKGLKMRIPGIGGEVAKRIGINAINLPHAEIPAAFEQGDIDAAEFVGPYEDEKLGLNKFAKFYHYPGWHEPGTNHDLLVNLDAWKKLPKDYQEALGVAAFETQILSQSQCESLNRQALQRLLASGTELVAFEAEILKAAKEAAFELYEENASKDATFKAVYTSWKGFRKTIFFWNRVNELSYDDFVFAQAH